MEYPVSVSDFPLTYHDDFVAQHPIVKVALRLAQKAHAGVSRGKADPNIPYIVHPIMVHDLLAHFGERDPLILATALLHDAVEDYLPYRRNPKQLYHDLRDGLQAEGVVDDKSVALYITDMCRQLTNDRHMIEGKRTWQVEHVGTLPENVAKIKILDQTASEIDSIVMPDAPDRDREKARRWSYKALNVVKSAAKGRPALDFWRNLHKTLFSFSIAMMNADSETQDLLRHAFSFEKAVARALEMKDKPPVEIATSVDRCDSAKLSKGINQVGLDADGNVASYAVLTNVTSASRHDARNEAAEMLCATLEAHDEWGRVTIGHRAYVNDRMVRMNYIKPPISADTFIGIARKSGALEQGKLFEMQIRDASRALQASQVKRS